jgi:hypothetical protein
MFAQTKPVKKVTKNKFTDSLQAVEAAADMVYDLPMIMVNEQERSDNNTPFLPSLLSANRDMMAGMAAFHFNVVRFRMRGYDSRFSETQINGISMNNPIDGNTQFGLWSGLNDVTRNTQSWQGLRNNEIAFGNIGNTTTMDMRASKQRVQEQMSYAFSNRSFAHRWMYSKSSGMNKKGWAFMVSGSFRFAKEGYVAGTGNQGYSYYLGIDKRIGTDRFLSIILFGSSSENGRQAAILKESAALAGSNFYNPYWGYQSGKKRNANISKGYQPVLIITHDQKMDNHSSWISSLGVCIGEKSSTAMDWYKAPDPRPDYYRYLPGYQTDSILRISQFEMMRDDERLRQINWDHLYEVNRNSKESVHDADGVAGNTVTGLRSHYILEERVAAVKRIELSSVYNTLLNKEMGFAGGLSVQLQAVHYYKKVDDLLGGEYFVDWNQFAETDFPNDPMAIQNDINHPNRILRKGDVYGYDYAVNTQKANAWLQLNGSRKKIDYFAAVSFQYLYYQREGLMQNGLFSDNSLGRSDPNEFANYACKAGITYKINGRKYLYMYGAVFTKAPLFDDVFISPRTRDTQQEEIRNQKVRSVEAGYVWNAPFVKMRISGYATQFLDGMNITTFYHDAYRSFVNYALTGIDKLHFGTELGIDLKLTARFSLNIAASVGRYYENSRQQVAVTADNDAAVLERSMIYSQNYRVAGAPQEAYGLGIHYQSAGAFYMDMTGSYFREQWIDYNPLRRTYQALENIQPGSDQWNRMIGQTKLPDQSTIDLSAGSSLRSRFFGSKKKHTLVIYVSINNLLNNQSIISGGYEQLRFDADTKNPDKFPPKYFYAMGLNFSVNTSLRL